MRSVARRMRLTWAAISGTGAGASTVLGILLVACVFVGVAAPRASLGSRTKALRELLAATPATGLTVLASDDLPSVGAALDGTGLPVLSGVSSSQLAAISAEITAHLSAHALPLARTGRWYGVATSYLAYPGAARSAYLAAGTPPDLEVLDRTGLAGYSRLVTGRWPAADRVTATTAHFEVAVTAATAARFSLHPGSVIVLPDATTGAVVAITLTVTGILRPIHQESSFWTADPDAAAPSSQQYRWLGAVFIAYSELDGLEAAMTTQDMTVSWEFPLALGSVNADQVAGMNTRLDAALRTAGLVTQSVASPISISLSSGLPGELEQFVQMQGQIGSLLSLLYVSLTVLGIVVLLLCAWLVADRRACELGLIRSRGASWRQLALLALRSCGFVMLPAAGVGALLGVAATPGADEPLSWRLATATTLAALIGVPLAAVRRAQSTGLVSERADRQLPAASRTRRLVLDATLVIAAVAGLVLLRDHGTPAPGSTNWYPSAAPVLTAMPTAVVVVRAYPVVVRWLVWLAGRRPGVVAFVGLARAARASLTAALPAFAMILALAVVAFGATLRAAVIRGDEAQSWRVTGADAVIDASRSNIPVSGEIERAIAALPGVRRMTAVSVGAATAGDGTTLGVLVVDPASYAAFLAVMPGPRPPVSMLARLAPHRGSQNGQAESQSRVPLLASPGAAQALANGASVQFQTAMLPARVVGEITSVPGGLVASPFVVIPAWALGRKMGAAQPPPDVLLVLGSVSSDRLRALAGRLLPGSSVSLRSQVLSGLTGAPLPHGAALAFVTTSAAAGGFAVVVVLIMLALGARSRELTMARLATMGLSPRQGRTLVIAEALPTVAAATVGGAVCAWSLVPLVGPSLNLAPLTGTAAPVPVYPDPGVIVVIAGCLLIVTVTTLLAQSAVARLRGITRSLRVID